MWHARVAFFLPSLCALAFVLPARGENSTTSDFKPDPLSVERYGPAYRYPQSGWVVLHIEGEPYERGYQHGRLMAPELSAWIRCNAALASAGAPSEGWKSTRT